jgi:putative phage-type endonuclease
MKKEFTEKLKEWVTLLENWLSIPSDNTQLETWAKTAEDLSDSFEFTDKELEIIDKIIEYYVEQYKIIIKNNNKNCDIPSEEFLNELINRKQVEQRSPEWYAQMTTVISASEIGNLFASARTRAKLVMAKTQPYVPRSMSHAVPSTMMSAFDWGIRFEPVVKQIYEYKYGVTVKELGRLTHPTDSRCTASPDGLVISCPRNERKGRLIEIKCPVTREIDGSVPKDYYAQMQLQLQVTGLKKCDYIEAEFSSKYNDNTPKEGPGLYNGFIALIRFEEMKNDQEFYYQYSEINCDKDWQPIINNGEEIVEIIPWRLIQWGEQIVERNDEWWTNLQPIINNFWEDVEKAKRGEFVIPESTRQKKPKEDKCIIVFKLQE